MKTLANLKLQLDYSFKLLDAGVSFRPRLSEINTRLEQLGPARRPGDQPPEPAIVSERTCPADLRKGPEINAIVRRKIRRFPSTRCPAKIGDMRRDILQDAFTAREHRHDAGTEVASAASSQMVSLWRIVQSCWRFGKYVQAQFVSRRRLFAFVAALVIQLGARRVLGTLYQRDPTVRSPPI